MKGLLIKTDGAKSTVFPKNKKRFSLEELQGFVGGLIDVHIFPDKTVIYLNDEGKLNSLPKNEIITELWKSHYPIKDFPLNNDELVVGDILLLSEEDDKIQNTEEEEISQKDSK